MIRLLHRRRVALWCVALPGLLCPVTSAQLAPGGKTAVGLNIDITEQSLINLAAFMRILDARGQDARGWPTGDFNLILDNRYTFAWSPRIVNLDPLRASTHLAGRYRLSFRGSAEVAGSSNLQYDRATNTTTADYEIDEPRNGPGSLFVEIAFRHTRRNLLSALETGVTDIRLVRRNDEKAAGQIFTDLWLDSLRNYPWAVLRTMGATGTNQYGAPGSAEAYPRRLHWTTDRRLPGTGPLYENATAGVHSMISWEDLVILAQLTHKDLWINVPVNASDDYVVGLASLLKNGNASTGHAGIPVDTHLYVEYSNELWHYGFPQGKWNFQAAQDEVKAGATNLNYDGAGTPERWRFRRIAQRTVEIGRQFRKIFSEDPDRIRPVINNQQTARDFDMLHYVAVNYGNPDTLLYGIAQQGYYTSLDASSPRRILEGESIASDKNRPGYVFSRMLATYFGLHSLLYEGGPDETGPDHFNKDPAVPDPNLPNKFAAARDPGMQGVIVHDLLGNWFASGGDLYAAFSQSSRYSFWGMFGQTEDLSNLKTGKWSGQAAVMQAPVPPLSAGVALPGDAGKSVEIPRNAYPSGETAEAAPWGMFLLRAPVAGTYSFLLRGMPHAPEGRLRWMVDNTLAGTTAFPSDAGPASPGVRARLKPGLHSLFVFLEGKSRVAIPPVSQLTVTAVSVP